MRDWLSDAVARRHRLPSGGITGVDIVHECFAYAENLTKEAGYSMRITYREGDVGCLPFAEDTFDWTWSTHCICYPMGELASMFEELMRVVKPGKSIIMIAWSSQQLLPGYPFLESKLNATSSSYLPFWRAEYSRKIKWLFSAPMLKSSRSLKLKILEIYKCPTNH